MVDYRYGAGCIDLVAGLDGISAVVCCGWAVGDKVSATLLLKGFCRLKMAEGRSAGDIEESDIGSDEGAEGKL